jgi:hypothetical protein
MEPETERQKRITMKVNPGRKERRRETAMIRIGRVRRIRQIRKLRKSAVPEREKQRRRQPRKGVKRTGQRIMRRSLRTVR